MEIKASDVQKLRQMTGAGLMDCKKALSDSGGDFDKAIRTLREQGIAKSSKRADRVAGEGLVDYWISEDGKTGILLELNCETDFVARNDEFIKEAKNLLQKISQNTGWKQPGDVPQEDLTALSGKIGEKLELKNFARFTIDTEGVIGAYIHPGAKLGVMIEIASDKSVSGNAAIKELARELALQVAGANPEFISRDEVPQDVIDREKEITKKQMEGQKKPENILDKIATGKLNQFYEANCLLDQPHVRDASGKTKVENLVDNVAKKEGVSLKINRFVRFHVGASS